MINVTYAITEACALKNKSIRSYGIVAYADIAGNGTPIIAASIQDITSDKQRLLKLIDDCNRLKLSSMHLHDVVEDFLADQ